MAARNRAFRMSDVDVDVECNKNQVKLQTNQQIANINCFLQAGRFRITFNMRENKFPESGRFSNLLLFFIISSYHSMQKRNTVVPVTPRVGLRPIALDLEGLS